MGFYTPSRVRIPPPPSVAGLVGRGAGAVERGGLENRCPSCGGPRVRIPPSPPPPRQLHAVNFSLGRGLENSAVSRGFVAAAATVPWAESPRVRGTAAKGGNISVGPCCSTTWKRMLIWAIRSRPRESLNGIRRSRVGCAAGASPAAGGSVLSAFRR